MDLSCCLVGCEGANAELLNCHKPVSMKLLLVSCHPSVPIVHNY